MCFCRFDFKGIIDYIFYGREMIRTLGVLGPLEQSWFEENHILGCPHPQIPSDHLPLLVQFELNPSLAAGIASSSSRVTAASSSLTQGRR